MAARAVDFETRWNSSATNALFSIRRPCVAEGYGSLRLRASIAHELSQSKI
jgi:hypothetical protein